MENSDDPITPNTRPSMLETLQLSFGELGLNNCELEIDGSVAAEATVHGDDGVPSSLPLNDSLTGVSHVPGLGNGEGSLVFSKMGSDGSSFNLLNLNGFEDSGYGFQDSSMFNNGFPNANPGFSSLDPQAISSGGNLFSSGFNINGFSNGNPGMFSLDPEATSNGGNLLSNGFNINGNRIIDLAMTENGSKFFQDLLLLKDPRITRLIFDGVIEFIFELMTDNFGRFLFQKLIECEDENQLQMIMEKLTVPYNYIYHASIDKYGSFSIKKLIAVLEKSPLITEIARALSSEFRKLMIDPIGQYVITECLDVLDSQNNDLLCVEAIKNCLRLAVHERGSPALNGLVVRIKGPRHDQLLNLISDHVAFLAQDPTGNSIVQCVLRLQNPAINAKIFFNLKGYYLRLSVLRNGSHIVEQCLRSSAGMEHVIHEFLRSYQLVVVAKNRYGNYVLQTALKETKKRDSKLHESLILKLRQRLNSLQHGYGRNIWTLMNSFSSVQFNNG